MEKTEFFCKSCGIALFKLNPVGKMLVKEQYRSYAQKPDGSFYCYNCYKVGKEPQKGNDDGIE